MHRCNDVPESCNYMETMGFLGMGKPKNEEEHRYYLLPGQGRGARMKRRNQLIAAWSVGLLASGVLGAIFWWIAKPR